MTCWKCGFEQSGGWRACVACGALSLANVEAVARGVASVAVELAVSEYAPLAEPEVLWEATVLVRGCDDREWHRHPTRRGAALAAFEAAWEQGAEDMAAGAGIFDAPLVRDDEGITHASVKAGHDRMVDAIDVEAIRAAVSHAVGTFRLTQGQALELHRAGLVVRSEGGDWYAVSAGYDPGLSRAPNMPCVVGIGGEFVVDDVITQAEDDAETVRAWCEETGSEVWEHPGEWGLALTNGSVRAVGRSQIQGADGAWCDHPYPVGWLTSCLAFSGVPAHVADAMVRQARRALGVAS